MSVILSPLRKVLHNFVQKRAAGRVQHLAVTANNAAVAFSFLQNLLKRVVGGNFRKSFPLHASLAKKRRGFHRAVFPFKLGLLGSANRASACACTAVDANVSVNYVLVALLADSANGALSSTCTASDALVGNLVCH
jgi:hypothetical protein